MKKKLFLMLLMSMFAMAAVTTSCNEDSKDEDVANIDEDKDDDSDENTDENENNGDDEGIYTPPANLTQSSIVQLLNDAYNATSNANERTETGISTDGTKKTKYISTTNRGANKFLRIEYDIDAVSAEETLSFFEYHENFIAYNYQGASGYSYKITDASRAIKVYDVMSPYNWTIVDNSFVGIRLGDRKQTITLTPDNKFNTVKTEYIDENYTKDVTYTYSANPAMPSGFAKENFAPIHQFSLKVVWGEGLGENTFYPEKTETIYLNDIKSYAPEVNGKTPHFYRDAAFTNTISLSLDLTDNNTILYVKWE